jgi:hypothetical protein
MYFNMRATFDSPAALLLLSSFIRNAIAESTVLHARILCDLFSSKSKSKNHADGIGFSDLFDDWETGERYRKSQEQDRRDEISVWNPQGRKLPVLAVQQDAGSSDERKRRQA